MYDMLLFVQNICSLNVCYRNILAEEGEIDAAVLAVFRKAGVGGEVRFDGVFDDGDAFRSEQAVVEDGCREVVVIQPESEATRIRNKKNIASKTCTH